MLNKQRFKNIVLAVFAVLFLLVLYTNFSDRPSIFSLINDRFLAGHSSPGCIPLVTDGINPAGGDTVTSTNFNFVMTFDGHDIDPFTPAPFVTLTDATPGSSVTYQCWAGSGGGSPVASFDGATVTCPFVNVADGTYNVTIDETIIGELTSMDTVCNTPHTGFTVLDGGGSGVDPGPPCEGCGNTGTQLEVYTSAYRWYDNSDRDNNKDEVGGSYGKTNEPFSCAYPGIPVQLRILNHIEAGKLDQNGMNLWTKKVERYKLKYAKKKTKDERCDKVDDFRWKDVGLASNPVQEINYWDNSHEPDGIPLAEAWEGGERVDPEHPISNSHRRVSQEYIDTGDEGDKFFTNTKGACNQGDDCMWSFALAVNKSVTEKSYYCLKEVRNYPIDGDSSEEPLDYYYHLQGSPESYPELSTCSSKKDLQKTVSLPPTLDSEGVTSDQVDNEQLLAEQQLNRGQRRYQETPSNIAAITPGNKATDLGTKNNPFRRAYTNAFTTSNRSSFGFNPNNKGEDLLLVRGDAQFGTATIKINSDEDTISFGDSSPGIIFGKGNNSEFTFYDAANADDKNGQNSLIKIIDNGSTANLDISGGLIVNSGGTSEKVIVNNKNKKAIFSVITDPNPGMGGKIGFGTDNPTTAIEAVSNGGLAPTFTSYNDQWWTTPGYILRKSLGTKDNPKGVTGKTEYDDSGNPTRFPEIAGRLLFQANDRPEGEATEFVDIAMITSQLDGEVDISDGKRIVPGSLSFWVRQDESNTNSKAMQLALYVNSQGNIGIGEWVPTVRLEVAEKDKEPQINLTRGDLARTTSISKDDVIGALAFRGDDKDIVEEADKLGEKTIVAKISSVAEANFGESESPGSLIFSTGNPAAGESVTERFRIDSGGHITIKPTDPEVMKSGYVLTAIDEDGKAEWKEAGGGVGEGSSFWSRNDETPSQEYIFPEMTTDKISIGTSTPATYTLDVVGDINIRDDGDDHKNYLLNGELLDVVDGLTAVQEPPASSAISAGEIELFKIKATANTSNDVEVGGAEFNLTLSNLTLEPNSIVVRYDGADLILSANEIAASGGSGKFVFKSPIAISGDESKTFWVYANVQSHQANASMVRSLKGVNGRGVTQWINTAKGISYAKGKVGLGVFDPSYALDVLGDINVSGEFLVNGEAFSSGGDDDWVIDGDNIYRGSGYVGVGTTSPISQLSLATSTAVSGGIAFGSDTNFYRSAAKTLKTDGKLIVDSLQIGDSTVNFGSDFLEFDTNPSEVRYNTKLSFKNTAEEGKTPVTLDGNDITLNELKDCSVLETDGDGKVLCGEAAGGFTSFDLAGDSGDDQEITDGNKLTIVGGIGIDTKAEDADKLTVSIEDNSIDFTHLKDTLALDADTIINLSNKKLTIEGSNSVKSEFLASGDVKLGKDLEVTGQITIKGGAPGANKVLTSSETGLATWEEMSGGHDEVTLGTDDHDYLSIEGQKITLGKLDISDDTNLTVEAPLAIAADGKLTISEDSIDFTHLKDTLALDADTIINLSNKKLTIEGSNSVKSEFLASGDVKLGKDLEVTGQITIKGGAPGANKVLTSSETGLATWEEMSGGHDEVTLGTDDHDYLSIEGQKITLGKLDISDDTNLTVEAPLAIAADGKLTISEDSIDFTHLKDILTLDASTVVKLGANNFDLQLTGAGIFQILKSDNTVLYKFEDGKLTVDGDIDITGKYLVNGQELDTSSAIKVASFEFTFEVYNDNSETITVDLTGGAASFGCNRCSSFGVLKSSGIFDSNSNIIVSPNIVAADIRTSFFNNTIVPEVKSVVGSDGKITISLVKKDIGISEYGGAPYGTVKIRVNAFQF